MTNDKNPSELEPSDFVSSDGRFKWKLLGHKVMVSSLVTVVSGVIAFAESDPRYLALVPLFEALKNFLKHSSKLDWKPFWDLF